VALVLGALVLGVLGALVLGSSSGIAYSSLSNSMDSGVGVAIQSDGKILLVGVDDSSQEEFVARFIATSVPVNPVPTLKAPGFVLLALLMLLAVPLVAGKRKRGFTRPARSRGDFT
jgi:hypothetical protein